MPTMPNLVGLGLWGAIASLEQSGVLNPGALGYFGTWPVGVNWVRPTVGDPYLLPSAVPGTVISQSVSSGNPVAANAAVQLTVVQYPIGVSYP